MFGWANKKESRSEKKRRLTLGYKARTTQGQDELIFRDPKLELIDKYYENRQYDHLVSWEDGANQKPPIPIRSRKPRIIIPFARTLCERVTAKLVGDSVFPNFMVWDFPDDQEFYQAVVRESQIKTFLLEPIRRMLATGEVFVRFYIEGGIFKKKWYHGKYCYPKFQSNGELESLEVKYVFDDKNDRDELGNPIKKWYKLHLGMFEEILYDNPEYHPGEEPEFKEVARVRHDLGFVQGHWFTTTGEEQGKGLITTPDVTSFIDELCYSFTQSSQAVSYNQDPQVWFRGMTEEEMSEMVRSAMASWNLGREGEVGALETNLNGVTVAGEFRDKLRLSIQDATRIVLLDPDKIVGQATSAKAMEVLHGPLKDLVDELRGPVGMGLTKLVIKMSIATLIANQRRMETPIIIPPGFGLQSINIELEWPPIFQQTIEDLQKKVSVAVQAASANIISRRTAMEYVAKDFGILDIEEEQARIDSQPIINPFGAF